MHEDEIPTRPPTFDEHAGPPTEAPAPTTDAAPAAATETGHGDVRQWLGVGVGVVAIVLAALVGTGVVSSDASTGGQGGAGGFRGNGAPPGFTRGPGGFGGGFPGGGQGGFPGGGQVPAPTTTTTPKTSVN